HDRMAVRTPLEHPEVRLAMTHVPVELDERPGVAEPLGALAGEQLARVAVPRNRLLRPGVLRLLAQLLEPLELLGRRLVRALLRARHRAQVTRRGARRARSARPSPRATCRP